MYSDAVIISGFLQLLLHLLSSVPLYVKFT